ncbi:MAG: transglutaminase domain-containing protein [Deltaproteobacteria bacterium]|nr:transglutaminase domain-containing protein [Deltaproteobacteria bacterium]
MKTLQLIACALILAFILPKCASGQQEQTGKKGEKTYYYGVEINDVLCGYAKVTSVPEEKEGKTIDKLEGIVSLKLSVLGGGMDVTISYLYLSDPATEQFFSNATTIQTGDTRMEFASGLNVQTMFSNRKIFLSDPSVVKRITTVNMDDILFARVNTKISNIHDIAYMKVKGKIESAGEEVTSESLNHLGQTFTGTVTDNLIEGVFELTAEKYDGTNAPPFPPDFTNDAELEKYLKPENLIESDELVLIGKAKEITAGSEDSWEAAKRLSKWVAENIEGAVPGGTSAINTYKTRQGECGSHSRLLAAFCRAVGIPSRLSVGCMYSSLYGGSFGQHAWTEVYMGEAGWIPVDAAIQEFDYVDSGHIRLGESTSFHPKEIEILEYETNKSTQK